MDSEDWSYEEENIEIISQPEVKEEENFADITINEDLLMEDKSICIDDVILMDSKKISSVLLMKYQCLIAYFIQMIMENNQKKIVPEKMETIIEYLRWMSNASEVLAKRIGQQISKTEFDIKSKNIPSIVRSSYNFCTKTTQCKNFYSKNEKPTCKEHHYVHALLKPDIDSIMNFIEYHVYHNIQISEEDEQNLYLSIKTICFVARHMAKEIHYIDYVTKNNSEIYHRNNPCEFFKKKVQRKQPEIKKGKRENKIATNNIFLLLQEE
jgi:hypothetical protein